MGSQRCCICEWAPKHQHDRGNPILLSSRGELIVSVRTHDFTCTPPHPVIVTIRDNSDYTRVP